MKQTLPWNVTGIPPEARDVARAAATREGLSVGYWLTRRILTDSARSLAGVDPSPPASSDYRRDELALRLARLESDADSAFRRIDETLRALTRRLESNERSQNEAQRAMSSAASDISAASRDQAEAFVLLTQRLERVEQGNDGAALRDAVRGLHQGLSRLTEQIARTATESSEHIAGVAGNLESARNDFSRLEQSIDERLAVLSGRLDGVEQQTAAAGRVEDTVAQLQTRVTSLEEHLNQGLGQQLAAIERNLEQIGAKLDAAERSGEEAQNLIRENLRHLSQRLEAAEKRSKDNWSEWKLSAAETAKRIESLEGKGAAAKERVLSNAKPAPESEMPGELKPIEDEVGEADETAPAPLAAVPPKPTVQEYLEQTRRAAEATAADPLAQKDANLLARNRRTLILQGLLVLFVLTAGFLLMQTFGPRPQSSQLRAPATALTEPPAPPTDGAEEPLPPALAQLQSQANAGNAKAALLLGLKYADGEGVAVNDSEAARWLQKATQAGEPVAQYRLATLYEKGRGVAADAKQAALLYEQAATRGNRRAMHNLAVAYANGAGKEKSFIEAARWFRAAAELGLPDSQFNLAVLYERGLGVRPSLVDAYKWYAIAAAAGDAESKTRVEALMMEIPPAEREAADRAAREFKLTPLNREANEAPAGVAATAPR